jgi:hypothetical protein
VRDAAGELAQRLHLLRLAQLVLRVLARGEVADEGDGARCTASYDELAHRELQREHAAVLAAPLDHPGHADGARLAGPEPAVGGSLAAGRRGQQQVDVPAHNLHGGIAEQGLGGSVEGLDHALGVGDHDRLGCRVEDRLQPCLAPAPVDLVGGDRPEHR